MQSPITALFQKKGGDRQRRDPKANPKPVGIRAKRKKVQAQIFK